MMAFPEGGQPLTRLVGVDNNTLSWFPQHPIGEERCLIVFMKENSHSIWQVRD